MSPGRLRRSAAGAVLVTVAATGGLTGCSDLTPPRLPTPTTTSPDPSPSLPSTGQAFRDARTFALSADSGHVVGTLGAGATAARIDLEGAAGQPNAQLVRSVPGRGTAVVRTVGEARWVAGDEAFWTAVSPSRAATRVGRWVPASDALLAAAGTETLRGVVTSVLAAPAVARLEGSTAPVTPEDVGGRAAWRLGSPSGGAQLWVAADGGGELLRVSVTGTGAADLVFDRWERATRWDPPAPGEVPVVPDPAATATPTSTSTPSPTSTPGPTSTPTPVFTHAG